MLWDCVLNFNSDSESTIWSWPENMVVPSPERNAQLDSSTWSAILGSPLMYLQSSSKVKSSGVIKTDKNGTAEHADHTMQTR